MSDKVFGILFVGFAAVSGILVGWEFGSVSSGIAMFFITSGISLYAIWGFELVRSSIADHYRRKYDNSRR